MKLKSYTNKDRYGNMTSFEFYEGASVDMGDVPPMMQGVPDHPGNPKGTDTVPAWLTPGEFVMNAEATRMFEPQIEQMNNAGRAMQAEQGGTIPEYAAHGKPIYAAAGGNSGFLANILKRLEGVKSEAYLDSAGKATIGAGSTRGVQMGDTASDDQVDSMLSEDIAVVDQDYGQLVSANLNTNQEAAVKSLLFNIGGPQFANSKARAALNAGDFESFKKEAAEFRKVGDEVIPGLENRRAQELALFDSPVGDDPWGINRRQVSTRDNTAKEVFDERIPDLQGRANERTSAEEFSGTGTAPRTAKEVFDERIPALRDKVDERNLSIPDELSGPEMGRGRTAQEVFDNRVPALRDKVDERNLSIPDELSGPEMGRGRTRKEIFESRIPALQDMINPEADEMLQASEFEGLGSVVPPMDGVPPKRTAKEIFDERISALQNKTSEADTQKTNESNTSLNQGEYGTHNTIVREDGNGNPITYKWDESKNSYVDSEGLKYNRSVGERVSSLFPNQTIENAEPETGDTQIGTLNGSPVFMGQDGNPYVMEDLNVLGTSAGVQKMKIQSWQTDDIKMLPKENRPVAGPKTPSPKDKDGLIDLPKDSSIPDELSGPEMSSVVPKPEEAPPKPSTTSTVTGMEDEYDEDLDSTTQTIVDRIISDDNNLPEDNTVTGKTTPEAATKAGEEAPPEQISKAESFLSGILGDLFDKGELKRMAIMYVGGRMLGGTHSGSLNFAAKQYVNRVDKKVTTKKAEDKALAKEKRLDLKAARKEFNKNLFDLNKDSNISKASIQAYKKSYDPKTGTADSSLLEQRVKPTPMNIDGNPELYYPIDGGKPVLGQKVKTGTKETGFSTMIVDQAGNPLKTYLMHQDKSRILGEPEFNKRVIEESGRYEKMMEALIKANTSTVNGEEIRPTDLKPSIISGNISKWAIKNDVDPNDMGQIIATAYESMKAENMRDPKVRHSNITKFLDGAYIPAMVGDPQLFNVPGTNSPGDLQEISKLSSTLVAKARASKMKGISNKSDNEVKDHIYKQFAREFKGEASYNVPDPSTGGEMTITLDEDMMKDFIEEAKKSNTSPFQLFIAQRLREPVKPK